MRLIVTRLLEKAGIGINGLRPFDMQIKDERVFGEMFWRGSLGLGESYINGWWDCNDLEGFFKRLLGARLDRYGFFSPTGLSNWFRDCFSNAATPDRAFETGKRHYDIGNDLFEAMLDKRMVYTCGYWPQRSPIVCNLDDAQERKLDLVCRKLGIKPGEHILDIGCGFGSFAKFAAGNYGATVTGITVSKEQAAYAQQSCRDFDVSIVVQDYRDFRHGEKFDKIVSLGMFEHVERKNYDDYFRVVNNHLASNGLFLLHTIGNKRGGMGSDPFIRKYIFPTGMIPDRQNLDRTINNGNFSILDRHEFGRDYWGEHHYAKTLRAWHANFSNAWPTLKERYGQRFDGAFERVWRYYLLSCAGAFSAGCLDVWQIVMTNGIVEEYTLVR